MKKVLIITLIFLLNTIQCKDSTMLLTNLNQYLKEYDFFIQKENNIKSIENNRELSLLTTVKNPTLKDTIIKTLNESKRSMPFIKNFMDTKNTKGSSICLDLINVNNEILLVPFYTTPHKTISSKLICPYKLSIYY